VIIKLTHSQAGWVDWALTGPIAEYGEVEELCHNKDILEAEARLFLVERDATKLEGHTLTLPDAIDPEGEFLADLLDMLEAVGPDVAEQGGHDELLATRSDAEARLLTHNRTKSCRSAAAKIRKAVGLT
jgi:hypothetical protein